MNNTMNNNRWIMGELNMEWKEKLLNTSMLPNLSASAADLLLAEAEVITTSLVKPTPLSSKQFKSHEGPKYKWNIVWPNVLWYVCLHIGALYGFYLACTKARGLTVLWAFWLAVFSGLGITVGAHRLWAHKAYKARWPLRVILAVFQTLAFQNHIYEWVRDHRVHHKFTDTDADPHNSKRGFFFSHVGWLMVKKHQDIFTKGKKVDLSDLENDWVVVLQKRYYRIFVPLISFLIPTWVPWYFWNENGWTAWYVAAILRYTLSLNFTWLVNSAAHIWGTRPYDKNISPAENGTVAILAFGEGWHNYHHAFPWDYKASEFSSYQMNLSKGFIDFMAIIGWAYDLKTVPLDMVKRRARRTGDGSVHQNIDDPGVVNGESPSKNPHEGEVWGWDDVDMTEEEKRLATVTNRGK